MNSRRQGIVGAWLAACCFLIYTLTSYGGIRSPDAEIMFRTSEALVTRGSFAVERGIETWDGFGLARGTDGRQYSIFGPLQAVLATPWVAAGRLLAAAGLFRAPRPAPPVSHYLGNGALEFVTDRPPADRDASGVRWVAAQFNIAVSTATVVLFYLLACRMAGSVAAALLAAIVFAFGTLVWPYAGTFFSEPLASLCALAGFGALVANDVRFGSAVPTVRRTALAGAALGGAVLTHITAVLLAPFFFLYALYPWLHAGDRRTILRPALGFAAGFGAMLLLLGAYDLARFGNALETGRGVDIEAAVRFGYGSFTNPMTGLYGLLLSPNKGLLLVCPAVVLAALAWPRLHRAHPWLSLLLLSAAVSRIVFIAARTDWHGGFALGPRYLVMILPYVCLPVALLARDSLRGGARGRLLLGAACGLMLCQQLHFVLGEAFSHYRVRDWTALRQGVDIIQADRIYLDWAHGPLAGLLEGRRGPFLLQSLPLGNHALFSLGCGVIAMGLVALFRSLPPDAATPMSATRQGATSGNST